MEPTQEKTAMENYAKFIAEIDEIVKQIKRLYDLAYTQYSHAVDEVISGRLSLPLNIDVEVNGKSYILVHGGAIAHYDRYAFKYDTQEEYAVWNRIHYKAPDIEGKTIIFGHTPTSEYQHNNPLEIWHSPSGGKIGIDCGCGFPHSLSQGRYPAYGRLACLRLDDMKVFYSEEEIHEEVWKKLYGNLAQPKVDHYIEWLRRNDHFGMTGCIYDDKSNELLDELFSLLEQVAPVSKNGARAFCGSAQNAGPSKISVTPKKRLLQAIINLRKNSSRNGKAGSQRKSSGISFRRWT